MNSNTVKITLQVDDKGTVKVKSMGKALDGMGQDARKSGATAGKSMGELNSQMGKTAKGADLMGKAVKGAMAYFSVKALASFEGHIVKTGMSFESTMATVKGVSRATDDEFKALTARAREMGETTEWSASQSADALRYMAMAGFTAQQSIAALPGVLDLATAGGLELGRASDIVTDSLTAMGLGVSDLAHFNDVLIATTTRSNTNIEMIGQSMKYVAPVAHSLGYEIETVSAMLGTLANAGIKGEQAGTNLSAILLKNAEVAKQFGTAGDDLVGTLKAATEAGWGATEMQAAYGLESVKAALVLQQSIDQYEALYGQLQDVDGATAELAGTMRDTTEGAWKEFKSVVESVELDVFSNQSNGLSDALKNLSNEIRENKDAIVDGLSAIGTASVQVVEGMAKIASYASLRSVSETFSEGARLAKDGLIEWNEFTKASFLDRQKMVDAAYEQQRTSSSEWLEEEKKIIQQELRENEDMLDQIARADEEAHERALNTALDKIDKRKAAEEKARKERLEAEEKAIKEEEKLLKKQLKENEDMLDDLGKIRDKSHDDAVDAAVDEYERKHDLLEDFEDVYDRSLGDQYQMDRDMVRAQAKLYEDAGADKVKVAEWAENEIEKINADELRAHQEAERKKALASDDFFAGMKVGYDDNLKYARTWAMTGYDIMRDFAQESGDVMSDVLFDAVKGDMASLGDYWESFWDSMLRSMTDYVGQMAAEWATAELINLGASFASAIFHSGSTGLKQDELLATLQEGEIVIPAKQSEAIREAIGTGGKSSEGFFNDVVGAVHAGTVHDFSPDSWGRPDIAGMAVGNLLSAGLAGAAAGYSNYGQTMNMGAALQSAGYEISTSAIRDVAMDQALAGAISTAIPGFAGGFIGDLGNYALGVSDYNIGTQLGDLNIGAIVNAGLSVLSGLGLPGAMCAALSPLTNLAMSGIADVMGLRANETLRDKLENKYGEIAGRRAYNAVSEMLGTVGAKINEIGTLSMSEFGTHSLTDIVGSVPFGYSQYGPGEISINLGSGLISNSDGKVAVGDYGSFVDVGMGSMTDSVLGDLSDFTAGLDSEFGPSVSSINDLMAALDSVAASELAAIMAASEQAANKAYANQWHTHGEAGGTSPGRSDGTTGGSMGAGIGAGNSPGSGSEDGHRWTGGPVSPGYLYEINERGQELFMPGQDGRILNAQETQEMLSTLKKIASGGGLNSDLGAALVAIARYCQESSKILKRWDYIGMPEARA